LDAGCAQQAAVFFPAGVYDVGRANVGTPGPFEPTVLLRIPCTQTRLLGEGAEQSRLRLMDGVGPFESLLATPRFADDASGLSVSDLGFDGNGAGNPVSGDAAFADLYGEKRFGIRVYLGSNITIRRCAFDRWRTVNIVVLNGVEVADVEVSDCAFREIGAPPASAGTPIEDWDHSSIYTDCDGAVLANNLFTSFSGPGTFGVRTAIETHGPRQFVLSNEICAFTTGMNATGISQLGSSLQVIQDNVFEDVSDGIRI
ncbi:MAG: right-handed parallel beta-helix repeat-containing protein, partial [Planctomycetota bacterium]